MLPELRPDWIPESYSNFHVAGLGSSQDGNVRISFFPESQEFLVGCAGFRLGILCRRALQRARLQHGLDRDTDGPGLP